MPEITDSQQREYAQYQALGTPEEIRKAQGDLEKVKKEAAERREANTALKTENDALKAKVPGDDAVILTGDDAAAFNAIKGANLTLKDVDAGLKERDTLKGEKAERARKDAWREAIRGEGWADVDAAEKALSALKDFDALTPELAETEVEVSANGKTEKVKKQVGFVTPEGGTKKRVGEWLQEVNPLLHTAVSGAKAPANGGTLRESPLQRTTSAPGTATAGGIDDMIAKNQADARAGNPISPRKTATA